jgi:hypothetical protein
MEILTEKIGKTFDSGIKKIPLEKKNIYEVTYCWDIGDSDFTYDITTFQKEEFENDILLKLFLAFIDKTDDTTKYFNDELNDDNIPVFGNYIFDNENIEGIEYLIEKYEFRSSLLQGHTMYLTSIHYYDKDGKIFEIELPDIEDFFTSKEQLFEALNYLIEKDNNENFSGEWEEIDIETNGLPNK